MRATDALSLTFDLDLDLAPAALGLPALGLDHGRAPADLAPRATRPRIAKPVVPPARHERRGGQAQPRSAPRPRPMRKPGGVR